MGRKKLWMKVLVTSVLLNGIVLFGGMRVGATDIGTENQIPEIQETETCYEFKEGVLTIKGIVDREQIDNFENKDKVEKIIAEKGTVLPSDCSALFAGYEKYDDRITKFINVKSIDLSNADTNKVTDMSFMFYRCSALTSLDISNFDTGKVLYMQWMFNGCSVLPSLDVSNFDTSNVMNMYHMFMDCSALTSLDVSHFDTSKVMSMGSMFWNCSALTGLDVSKFDTGNVINMQWMFSGCSRLPRLDVGHFDTSKVMNMSYMFWDCNALTSLDVSSFNTANVTDMQYMFKGCSALQNLDVSKFDTSKVTNMGDMFTGCSALTSLDVSSFDTSKVTKMGHMFMDCSTLTSLDVSHFDTQNVTDMFNMFTNCSALTSLDVSRFDTTNVTNMVSMFSGCSSLNSLNLEKFDTSKVMIMIGLFYGCDNLCDLKLGENFKKVDKNCALTNGETGWAKGSSEGERISGSDEFAVIENEGVNTYYRIHKHGGESVIFHEAKEATCTEPGNTSYYECSCGKCFEDDSCSKEIEKDSWIIPAKGHDYGEITYVWSDDNKSVTATRICKNDETHKDTKIVDTTYEVVKEPTEKETGSGRYTATFAEEGFTTQTKEVEIPKLEPASSKGDVTEVFTDMPTGEWYLGATQFVYDNGIMNGVSETAFGPKIVLAREQFITVLYNMEGAPDIAFKQIFDDVKDEPNVWYAKSITWAAENKITSGIGNNLFGTGKEITREQLATLLYYYAKQIDEFKLTVNEDATATFPDAGQISEWATTGMKWAVTNGVMGGKTGNDGKNILDPQGKASRAECAQMIKNLKEKAIK